MQHGDGNTQEKFGTKLLKARKVKKKKNELREFGMHLHVHDDLAKRGKKKASAISPILFCQNTI